MQLVRFLLKKTIRFLLLLVAVSMITFVLISLSPIDPIRAYIGADLLVISPEQKANIEAYWGLNEPMFLQYVHWLSSLLTGDFGVSLTYRTEVTDVIADRFFASIILMALAWVMQGMIGIVLGIIAALKKDSWIDKWIKGYCYVLLATPSFWLGLVLLMLFAVWLDILPVGLSAPIGLTREEVSIGDRIYHAILPALTLSIIGVSSICLHTREKLLEVMNQPYIRQARANGLSGWTLFRQQAFPNMIIPVMTLHFASFGELFGGVILAEQVFSYPGMGQAIVDAGLNGDIPLLLGIVLISACFVFIGNFLADFFSSLIDPRLRNEGWM
ncbi:ABC transporter permease [Gracilibacillus marinus]|uniref:ABC transporter permease n=1 Tax=Gracilibacillus marinus TaxID=630535 RepID=A0ABV8VUP5_9BACI